MNITIHNPDQYMSALRTIIAQGRKRIGLLIGAGAPAGMKRNNGSYPLIPAIDGLTDLVLDNLQKDYSSQIETIWESLGHKNIETFLSKVRSYSEMLSTSQLHGLDGEGYKSFGNAICKEIGNAVQTGLPTGDNAYSNLVHWIVGTMRDHPVEIFTTNYDLLFEEAFERVRAPYFDGFTGARQPFFDPISVARNDVPPRWSRLWKVHGSLGWCSNDAGEIIRTGSKDASQLVFPAHLKYDQTQKAPYSSYLDRLQSFLASPDSILISIGFSFADAHIAARIGEGLGANAQASVFAFQYKNIDEEPHACDLAKRLPNFSVYARDSAMVNGAIGEWRAPYDLPTQDWGPIRDTYWSKSDDDDAPSYFKLGAIEDFARFFSAARSVQAFGIAKVTRTEPAGNPHE